MAEEKKLNNREKEFCLRYVRLRRKSEQAAREAGYSEKSARGIAWNLLQRPEIKAYIDELYKPIEEDVRVHITDVLLELKRIAFFDIRKVYDDNGNLLNIKDFDDDSAAAITSIKTAEEFVGYGEEREKSADVREIKLADKRAALADICKILGYNKPEQIVATIKNIPDLSQLTVEQIRELLAQEK